METNNYLSEELIEETSGLSIHVDFKNKVKRKTGWKLSPNHTYYSDTKKRKDRNIETQVQETKAGTFDYEEIKKDLEIHFLLEVEKQLQLYINNDTIRIEHARTNNGSIEIILAIYGAYASINDFIETTKRIKNFINSFFQAKINNKYGDLFVVKTKILDDPDPITFQDIFNHFFWFCAGAKIEYIKQCPTDHIKYAGIGITVFGTGILAFASGGYAFHTVFNNVPLSISFGLLWAFIIFFWDRFLVSSIRKEGNRKKELLTALPRILIALVISFIVSNPIELRLFEKEINLELKNEIVKFEKIQLINSPITTRINSLDSIVSTYNTKITNRENQLQNLRDSLTLEVQGRLKDKLKGDGPAARTIRANYDSTQKELNAFTQFVAILNDSIAHMNKARNDTVKKVLIEKEKTDGFLARNIALHTLRKTHPLVNRIYYCLALLVLLLEIAPIIVKIISSKGVYDILIEKLEKHEFSIYMRDIQEKNRRILIELQYLQHAELTTFDELQQQSTNIKIGNIVNEKVINHLQEEHLKIQKLLSKKLSNFIKQN